ncbi:uncharacterized protein LOC106635853 [Copidosoma floridanum]|uniref:uncharacterized protein LOC106635853 n=1 Tax=Copidosoma floridanum TaxID=29053 RepID=UPI0006C9AE82|nr:uncharacterized protein LOC106635853 [Copidosoma floridanum]
MAKYLDECKYWISCIQTLKLEDIDTTNFRNLKQNAESNKYLFKVLLHLSHCADKCYKEKLSRETHVFKIAAAVCENLTSIPDLEKYYSALYYVVFYLLLKPCFKEAKLITKFLLHEKFLNANETENYSKYLRLAGLWQTALFKKLDTWSSKTVAERIEINEEFINYVNFHLSILNNCNDKDLYILSIADMYVKKLSKIPLDTAFPCLEKIFKTLSNYISGLTKIPVMNVYNKLIVSIGCAFAQRSDAKNNSNIFNYFVECDKYFVKFFASDSQCSDCYKLFRVYFIHLFETNFMSKEINKASFEKIATILEVLLKKYSAKNTSLIQTISAIAMSFETLFNNWEQLVSLQLANTTITYDDIVKMGGFVKTVHNILLHRKHSNNVCKQCSEPDKCLVKTDIYQASVITATYIKVLTKANQETLNEKMFAITKELLEFLVSAVNKLQDFGCKYSSLLWETCGRLIFNIGLISENKYAGQLEGLYETLCKQIVHYDGLQATVSSFGLENPVGTSLHRLCNIYFNQENYRQAMTFAAYNALLSNFKGRKKKACDMWANIKLRTKDSKEFENLTMSECLRTDVDVIKKFGISINLDDYDLNDLCLKELGSLFLIKSDILSTMKRTLNELESKKSVIEFAQGTLLLCFHALQLSSRKSISNYISKAIEKLKKCKKLTSSNQCLLANLSFFSIIEKLFVRGKVIGKQMEDANFTIKAFKTLKGNKANTDVGEENEIIVPTFGGISIEEDNKLSNELRDVLNLWESCMLNDMSATTTGWEPKYTLETIIFCGEYCRLFKFGAIEERSLRLAHKLATAIQDFTSCIYVTSRSFSIKFISDIWLNSAKQYADNIMSSEKSTDHDVVSLFWLSLADLYLDCKKVEEAKVLIDKVKSIPNFSLLSNAKLYIYLADIQLRNYFTLNLEPSQETYSQLIVEIHYLLINLYEIVSESVIRFWNIKYHLFACEMMFEVLNNVLIPMNCLISYRDTSLHLSMALKLAQKLGISQRIAEILKYLCYIDLLRSQIDSCETHLQDLEHILCLDNFQASMKTKLQPKSSTTSDQLTSTVAVRDAAVITPVSLSKNCASPELKKKLFVPPLYLEHSSFCQCFFCNNVHYQQLVFSCSHIQAQLFCLLKYVKEAERYFYGACKIKLKIDERDAKESRQYREYQWKRPQKYTVDYLLYLMDFSLFIVEFKPDQKKDALELFDEIKNIAANNDLSKHCVTYYATDLYAQYYISDDMHTKLNIYVSQNITIDVTKQELPNCITPKVQIEKTTRNLRRRKSPQPIALPIITISDRSDVESDCGNSPVPSASKSSSDTEPENKPKRRSARNVRRKILTD